MNLNKKIEFNSLFDKIPEFIKVLFGGITFYLALPLFFENEEAIGKYYAWTSSLFFGHLIITFIFMMIIKIISKSKVLKIRHLNIAALLRIMMSLLAIALMSEDFRLASIIMLFLGLGTFYSSAKTYIIGKTGK